MILDYVAVEKHPLMIFAAQMTPVVVKPLADIHRSFDPAGVEPLRLACLERGERRLLNRCLVAGPEDRVLPFRGAADLAAEQGAAQDTDGRREFATGGRADGTARRGAAKSADCLAGGRALTAGECDRDDGAANENRFLQHGLISASSRINPSTTDAHGTREFRGSRISRWPGTAGSGYIATRANQDVVRSEMEETPLEEPFALFDRWYAEAQAAEPDTADAMTLATADAAGRPSARTVLLKGFDERGPVFYTNLDSRKGRELAENNRAALLFHWKGLGRQIRIEGPVTLVSEAEADAYFASRPRGSQIGAWASKQSQPMPGGRAEFEQALAEVENRFAGQDVPRPPRWSGFRLVPEAFEFWEEGQYRLHKRRQYQRRPDGGWQLRTLYP